MRWTLKPKPNPETVSELMQSLNVSEIVAALLAQRGIETYEQARLFFSPTLDDLHDPFLMTDMDNAVARIEWAMENGENILVFGDYDVDGTTAVALVSSYLKTIYANVDTYIPDRYNEGYGVSRQGIDYADDNDCKLIIALDCGIKSVDLVAYARSKGIDFIICDHHRPGDELPAAIAVLDPKRDDCTYPYDELCGCGVGFKLVQALGQKFGHTIEDLKPYLDLVATAIAADIVPMTGENRILAKFGLEIINSSPRPGIAALMQQQKKSAFSITDVVFILAPRINAAGRIKHGNEAVKLLTEFNLEQAAQFASEIESYNAERKGLDKQITAEALLQIEENGERERFTTVVYDENWHKGVIGIVASRLIETHYRPTIVFTKSNGKLAASARSVRDFDIYNALEACADHLEQFGGHMYAAGMTISEENFPQFKEAFEATVRDTIPDELRIPETVIDAEIDLTEVDDKLVRILKRFEPFGPENMTPVFLTKKVNDLGYGKTIGEDGKHLRLFVKQGKSDGFAAIGFGLGSQLALTTSKKPIDIAYAVEENEWNGAVSIQLRLKDLRAAE